MFSLDHLKMSQTEFFIHHLAWWNKFLMHDAFNIKKKNKKAIQSTFIAHCFKLVSLSLVTVKYKSFTDKTAASSQGHTQDSSPVVKVIPKLQSFSAYSLSSVQTGMQYSF
jgi:hypothetical protein